ncbi:EAL domain-containing protein [Burkholderia gladioli]|uniref:EAL domain-containing protein n=1 Tax=Burkholderia gladioli TaxID=28095 RepID=UPI001641F6EE|nr:EAL domain-containing protein [Burkholderia gladioli]
MIPFRATPRHLVILIGVVASLLLVAFAAYEIHSLKEKTYRSAKLSLVNYASSLSRQAADIMKSHDSVVSSLAETLAGKDARDVVAHEHELVSSMSLPSSIAAFSVYDASRNVVLSLANRPDLTDASSPNAIQHYVLPERSIVFSSPNPRHVDLVPISQGLLWGGERYRWFVTTLVDFSSFNAAARVATSAGDYEITLIDPYGVPLLAFPNGHRMDQQSLERDASNVWYSGGSGYPSHEDTSSGPVERIAIGITGTPLYLHISIHDEALDRQWQTAAISVATFSLVILALIWLLVAISLRQISQIEIVLAQGRRSEAKLIGILSCLSDGIVATDFKGGILYVNHAALGLLGNSGRDDLIKKDVSTLVPASLSEQITQFIASSPDQNSPSLSWAGRLASPSGTFSDAEARIFATGTSSSDAIVVALHDVTHQKVYEARLSELATTDPASGLANLPTFMDVVARVIASSADLSFCHGILVIQTSLQGGVLSDAYQSLLADRLIAVTRGDDSLGSDGAGRFFMLVRNIEEPLDLQGIAERILEAYDAPFHTVSMGTTFTVSVGIAVFPFDGDSCATLIKNATSSLPVLTDCSIIRFANVQMSQQLERMQSRSKLVSDAIWHQHISLTYAPVLHPTSGQPEGFLATPQVLIAGKLAPLSSFSFLIDETDLGVQATRTLLDRLATEEFPKSGHPISIFLPVPSGFLAACAKDAALIDAIIRLFASGIRVSILFSELFRCEPPASIKAAISMLRRAGIDVYLHQFGRSMASLKDMLALGVAGVFIDESYAASFSSDDSAFAFLVAVSAAAGTTSLKVFVPGVDLPDVLQELSQMHISGVAGQAVISHTTER